jgi:hypothetical protein
MRIHCDRCGRPLDAERALRRTVDGEQLWFCGEACAAGAGHVADEPWAEDEGGGPAIPGDLDDAPPREKLE